MGWLILMADVWDDGRTAVDSTIVQGGVCWAGAVSSVALAGVSVLSGQGLHASDQARVWAVGGGGSSCARVCVDVRRLHMHSACMCEVGGRLNRLGAYGSTA